LQINFYAENYLLLLAILTFFQHRFSAHVLMEISWMLRLHYLSRHHRRLLNSVCWTYDNLKSFLRIHEFNLLY